MHPPYPSPEFVQPLPPKPPGAVRALAVAGGVLALLVGTVLSLGMGLAALLGFGLTALVWRARNARLTRRASWIGAVLAVMVSSGAFMVWAVSRVPGGVTATMQQSMAQAQREPPPPIVQRMEKIGPPRNPLVQRQVDSLTRSRPFLWWMMAMGFTLANLFFGLLVGTPAWGCAMLIGYGIHGRWPMRRPGSAASAG